MSKQTKDDDGTLKIDLTHWERSCLTEAVGAVPTATLNDVENLLEFKQAIQIPEGKREGLIANTPDDSVVIRLKKETLKYAWQKLQSVRGFPVAERTVKLRKKINSYLD